jgi:hypothetical protein
MRLSATILIILLALLAGCSTTVTTQRTDTVQAVGAPSSRELDQPLTQQVLLFSTAKEPDGFFFERRILTDTEGRARVTLLPAALQCLVYGHAVLVSVWAPDQDREVSSESVTPDRALEIVQEWHVQTRLGATARLRGGEIELLDRAIESVADAGVVAKLRDIAQRVELQPDWE